MNGSLKKTLFMYYNSAHWLVIIASSTSCVKKTAFLFLSELRQISTNFRCQSGWNCLNAPWLTNSRIETKKLTHSTFWNRVRWTECVLEKYFSQFTENTIPKSVISEFWNFTLQNNVFSWSLKRAKFTSRRRCAGKLFHTRRHASFTACYFFM